MTAFAFVQRTGWVTGLSLALLIACWPSVAVAQGRPDIAWFGKGAGVWGLAMSPDRQTFVTLGAVEHALKMWRIDGTFVRTFGEGSTPYWSAAFSPDGQFLIAGREGVAGATVATASIFRVSDGELMRGLNADFQNNLYVVHGVDYSPQGDLVAVAYNNYSEGIKLYNPTTGALVRTLNEGGYVAKFSRNGQMVAGARNGAARLWRVSDGATLFTLAVGGSLFAFSPDGNFVAVASGQAGSAVRIFRTVDGGLERTIAPSTVQYPQCLVFAPNQNLLVISGSRDAAVPVVGHSTDEAIDAYHINGSLAWSYFHSYGCAFGIDFTPDGQTLMVGGGWDTPPTYVEGGDDVIQRLNASNGAEVAHLAGHRGLSYAVDFSPDSQFFASAGNFTMQVWNVGDGTVAHTFDHGASSVNYSHDGTKLVAAVGAPIEIWSVRGGNYALLRILPGHQNGTNQAVFSPDGTKVGSGGFDSNAKLWRVSDGALLWTRPSNAGRVETVAISPDGQVLAGGCASSTVVLWRISDGLFLRNLSGINAVDSIAFSPDSALLAVAEQAYGNNLKLYRVSDGALIHAFPGSQGFQHQSVTFTPDGRYIVFSSGAQFIQFWRVSDFALGREYDREMGTGLFDWLPVAVSPDGRFFGYGRQDSMVVMARNPFACPTDINHSGATNVDDLLAVINAWGAIGSNPADVNHDNVVNVDDLLAVINAWGPCR